MKNGEQGEHVTKHVGICTKQMKKSRGQEVFSESFPQNVRYLNENYYINR